MSARLGRSRWLSGQSLLCCAIAWATSTLAGTTLASAATEAERAELSEELLQLGREAFESKRYQEAHQQLSRAYRLLQSYRTACALGQVELELEKYRDAAEHLDVCVARYPADDPRQARDLVLDGLRETRRHVAVFEPLVRVRGAKILINGVEVGTTPLASDLFVEPGLRRVTVRKAGFADDSAELLFAAGGTTEWKTELRPLVTKPMADPPSVGSVYLGIGTALTAVTLAGGVAMSVIAHVDQERATRAFEQAERGGACPAFSTRGSCVAAREQFDAAAQTSNLATATLWAGAGLGAVTAIVAWVTSPSDARSAGRSAPASAFRLYPSLQKGGAVATCLGRF